MSENSRYELDTSTYFHLIRLRNDVDDDDVNDDDDDDDDDDDVNDDDDDDDGNNGNKPLNLELLVITSPIFYHPWPRAFYSLNLEPKFCISVSLLV